LSLGLLDAVTGREVARFQNTALVQGEEPVEPMTNYLVGRVRRDSRAGNTSFGGVVTAVTRDLADSALAALLRHDAYFAGLDFSQAWKQREWVLDARGGRDVRDRLVLSHRSHPDVARSLLPAPRSEELPF